MSENVKSVLFLIGLFVALPILILWARDRISAARWRRRNPPEKLATDRRAYEARILQPNWSFYEEHLQRPVPRALRELYGNRTLVTAQDIDCGGSDAISTFAPIDEQGLMETRLWLDFDAIAIATTDGGDPIYLRPGKFESDVVYITHHDGGDTEVFSKSVEAFSAQVQRVDKHA